MDRTDRPHAGNPARGTGKRDGGGAAAGTGPEGSLPVGLPRGGTPRAAVPGVWTGARRAVGRLRDVLLLQPVVERPRGAEGPPDRRLQEQHLLPVLVGRGVPGGTPGVPGPAVAGTRPALP